VLSKFEIDNFRVFSHLKIPRLGRVNLVIGANNVGKTMLLEALRLYASGGHPSVIYKLLAERNEFYHKVAQDDSATNQPYPRIESLFFNRELREGDEGAILLRACGNDPRAIGIHVEAYQHTYETPPDNADSDGKRVEQIRSCGPSFKEADFVVVSVIRETGESFVFPTNHMDRYSESRPHSSRLPEPPYVPATGTDTQELARQWDAVALRDEEQRVMDCLRIVEPIEKISVVADPTNGGRRIFMIRMPNVPEPVPLQSLGDGMIHMLQIALALETARNNRKDGNPEKTLFDDNPVASSPLPMLLIDEVENGIYHKILPKLWNFIIEGAKRFDVQVFATTHSFDCVRAFQAAAAADPESEGVVMRLEKHGDHNKVVLYDEEEMSTAVEQGIEVR